MVFVVQEWIYRELPCFHGPRVDLIENYNVCHGPRMDLSRITMVSMVQEWIYRELPWFSWSQGGSERQLHSFEGLKGTNGSNLNARVDQDPWPPAQIFI